MVTSSSLASKPSAAKSSSNCNPAICGHGPTSTTWEPTPVVTSKTYCTHCCKSVTAKNGMVSDHATVGGKCSGSGLAVKQ